MSAVKTDLKLVVMYRRAHLYCDCSEKAQLRGCTHKNRQERLEGGPDSYRLPRERSLKAIFDQGRAAFAEGVSWHDNPHEAKAKHRAGHYRNGSYVRASWAPTSYDKMREWHWQFGWAWAEAYDDEAEVTLRAFTGESKINLWKTWVDWLYRDGRK